MRDVAKSSARRKNPFAPAGCAVVAAALSCLLSGCIGGGLDIANKAADSSVLTAATPAGQPKTDETSDQLAIGQVVGSADPTATPAAGIPWANASTGSAGVITSLVEEDVAGQTCRNFETSRHGYEGVSLYVGSTCKLPDGRWQVLRLEPKA